MAAARHVDQVGALRQGRECLGVQDAARLARERQYAHQDVALRQQPLQAISAVESLNARYRLLRPAPTGRRKSQRRDFLRRILADRTQPQDADAAMDGVDELLGLPRLGAL